MFLIDQGCDLLFFLLMLSGLVAMSVFGDAQWPHQGLVQLSLLGLALLAVGVSLMMGYLPKLLRTQRQWLAWIRPSRRRWLVRRLLRCRHALRMTLALPKATLAAMLALTTLHWLPQLAVPSGDWHRGHADWLWTFLTQMLAMAASQFSFLPGGAGAAEVGVGSLLLPLMGREQAVAAVLVWRLISYHLYLAAGAPLLLLYSARLLRQR